MLTVEQLTLLWKIQTSKFWSLDLEWEKEYLEKELLMINIIGYFYVQNFIYIW